MSILICSFLIEDLFVQSVKKIFPFLVYLLVHQGSKGLI